MSKYNRQHYKVRWAGQPELFTAQEIIDRIVENFPDMTLATLSQIAAVMNVQLIPKMRSANESDSLQQSRSS